MVLPSDMRTENLVPKKKKSVPISTQIKLRSPPHLVQVPLSHLLCPSLYNLSLNLRVSFPHLENEDKISTYLTGVTCELNE